MAHGVGDGELFKARGAQLYLAEGGERVLMQSGQFALMLVKNPVSQLAAVVAMVGEVQWPVGRDSTVVRGDDGSFTFKMPGPLTYTLVLASASADLQKLEDILKEYSDCQERTAEAHPQQNVSTGKGQEQTLEQQSPISGDSRKRAIDITSSQITGRMLRARRMSAVEKVFLKSLERGAIKVASHVEPMPMAAPLRQISSRFALASVDAVAKVVEAVETGGRTLLESAVSASAVTGSHEQKDSQDPGDASSDSTLNMLINSGWTLNKLGLLMLFRVITASMAIHSGGSSSSGSSRSGSSSSSEFRRLLSSSSSSSSLSSKSPATPSHAQSGGTADVTSSALSLQSPPMAGTMASSSPVPPPPPLFSQNAPRVRHLQMPPPSGPVPPRAGPPALAATAFLDPQASTPFRIYKPRPTPAASTTIVPPPRPMPAPPTTIAPPPPLFAPRPPRFQHPPKG